MHLTQLSLRQPGEGGRYGVATMCGAVGQGVAVVFEKM